MYFILRLLVFQTNVSEFLDMLTLEHFFYSTNRFKKCEVNHGLLNDILSRPWVNLSRKLYEVQVYVGSAVCLKTDERYYNTDPKQSFDYVQIETNSLVRKCKICCFQRL